VCVCVCVCRWMSSRNIHVRVYLGDTSICWHRFESARRQACVYVYVCVCVRVWVSRRNIHGRVCVLKIYLCGDIFVRVIWRHGHVRVCVLGTHHIYGTASNLLGGRRVRMCVCVEGCLEEISMCVCVC